MKKALSLMLALVLSLAACGGKAEEPVSVDVNALYESFSQYMPDMFYPDEATMLDFVGIHAEDCVQYKVAICAEGMRSDEVWLIEAKDADALARIQSAAQTRLTAKDEESATYSPEQNAIVKKAVTFSTGNYFMMVVSPDVDTLAGLFRTAAGL